MSTRSRVLFSPQEVPTCTDERSLHRPSCCATRGSRSPAAAAENPDDVRVISRDGRGLRVAGWRRSGGGRACRSAVSPVSPLIFTEKVTAAIMVIAEAGIPFHSLPAPSLGATGPITLAGCPGTAACRGARQLRHRRGDPPGPAGRLLLAHQPARHAPRRVSRWGGPEVGMAAPRRPSSATESGFPATPTASAPTPAVLDPQYAYERMANAMIPALAGT